MLRISQRLTKRGKTLANVILTLSIWHHYVSIGISNIIWKFKEEIAKLKQTLSFHDGQTEGRTDGRTDRQTDRRAKCIEFSSKE